MFHIIASIVTLSSSFSLHKIIKTLHQCKVDWIIIVDMSHLRKIWIWKKGVLAGTAAFTIWNNHTFYIVLHHSLDFAGSNRNRPLQSAQGQRRASIRSFFYTTTSSKLRTAIRNNMLQSTISAELSQLRICANLDLEKRHPGGRWRFQCRQPSSLSAV